MKQLFKVNMWTIIVCALIVLGGLGYNKLNTEIKRWKSNYETAQQDNESLQTEVSKLDAAIISSKRTIELTQKELKAAMKSDSIQKELVKHWKKVASSTNVETVIQIDSIPVPYPVYVDKDTIIKIREEFYALDIDFKDDEMALYNFYMENRQDIVLGERKTSLWKTEQAVEVRNTNPYIKTTGITTYNVVVEQKWHQKWWITVPVSGGLGYLFGRMQ